ncbi:hypothetical protein B5M09_008546 [Aphanomyces astaci]|uniref:Uncharacterized protein n=1 Tax=Aphanomyces astaci TaxID=112090 RepID=A0A3R7YVJ5_APHAT|nr:hypothetical protein B5M09_008546 [Aphanomyces astaci]
MQKEHDAQLAKERELIVHQVLQSLETKGLLRRKKPSTRHHHHKHPTKLDTRLQALVRHSLTDSGLDYPHVIPSQNTTVSSSLVRPLVLERKDTTDEPMEARRVSARQGSTQGDSRPQRRVDAALPPATAADPPNQVVPCAEKSILTRSKRSSKMSKKTWVMLEQSKKLLQATKTSGYKPGVIAPKPHLDQILAHNEQRPNDGEMYYLALGSTPVGTCELDENCSAAVAKNDAQAAPASYQLSLLEPFPTSGAAENTDKAWENELARQILSLYATSMTSKQHQKQQQSSQQSSTSPPPSSPTKSDEQRRRRRHKQLPSLGDVAERKKRIQHVQDSWQPSHVDENGKVVLCMPKIPKPIWFAGKKDLPLVSPVVAIVWPGLVYYIYIHNRVCGFGVGTGIVMATWCALVVPLTEAKLSPYADDLDGASMLCRHRLCHELRHLEQNLELEQYLAVVETLLMSRVRAKQQHQQDKVLDELDVKLWKQLVITANAFASRAVDLKKFPLALSLVQKAMTYISKAHVVHSKHGEWSHLAKCKLHMATLLSRLDQHPEAVLQLQLILALVEEAKLEEDGGGGASAQKLCLVAVCYNNLALEQLHLKDVDGAATSTQNARRLARLCLSYSNRWLAQFENTHKAVIRAMATLLGDQRDLDMELVMKYDIEA